MCVPRQRDSTWTGETTRPNPLDDVHTDEREEHQRDGQLTEVVESQVPINLHLEQWPWQTQTIKERGKNIYWLVFWPWIKCKQLKSNWYEPMSFYYPRLTYKTHYNVEMHICVRNVWHPSLDYQSLLFSFCSTKKITVITWVLKFLLQSSVDIIKVSVIDQLVVLNVSYWVSKTLSWSYDQVYFPATFTPSCYSMCCVHSSPAVLTWQYNTLILIMPEIMVW